MPTNDPNSSNAGASHDDQLPVDDLNARTLDPAAAEAVKGGREPGAPSVSEIVVTKPTDSSTVNL